MLENFDQNFKDLPDIKISVENMALTIFRGTSLTEHPDELISIVF